MKRFINCLKAVALTFALVVVTSPVIDAKAAIAVSPPSLEDFGAPISETTYEDEELGCLVTERIYFYSDSGMNARSKSGSGWYRNDKTYEWASGQISAYYAQGYFKWGNGNVSVSSPSGTINSVPSKCTVSNKKVSSGTGKYGLIFNNYAYVTFSCTVTSVLGSPNDFSVTIRVSENGNTI